ncbi:nucleoside hydrolase [Tropicimonas sp. IMCC34011]|uniref:nucleoside hydrolase n=1 Tax=Tropicimonas sp. IMCC34011 TaxID=2248759 RepID=UPI000E22A314|nr:nucleoside hydrolase [Tropicimonas sp. IMCC34011]
MSADAIDPAAPPVWIDTDMGVDDLFAILAITARVPVAGVSVSFGCSTLPRACENAAGAAELFCGDCALFSGADRPLLGRIETAERILGPRGMPTRGMEVPPRRADLSSALPALTTWLEEGGGPILALGPLTNLATLALARPDLRPDEITWMGGSLGRGNHTEFAEFNALADALAVQILLERGTRIRMIDLEACRKVQIVEEDIQRLPCDLLQDLMGGYLDIGLSRGRSSMALYDPVAAAALLAPELFRFEDIALEVDISDGERRGQTRRVEGPANAEIAAEVDAEAVREWCFQSWASVE